MTGYTQRFPLGGHIVSVHEGNLLAMHLVGCPAIVLEVAGCSFNIGLCCTHRLAAITGFQSDQFIKIFLDQHGQPAEQTAALGS